MLVKIITRFGGAHLFILTDRRVIAQSYGALENTKVSFLNLTIPIIVLPRVYCFGKINGPLPKARHDIERCSEVIA